MYRGSILVWTVVGLLVVAGSAPSIVAMPVIDLGTLHTSGNGSSTARDINNTGQVVGGATDDTNAQRAFLFQDLNGNLQVDAGEMTNVGTIGGLISFSTSVANGISTSGSIVGSGGSGSSERGFTYTGGVMTAGLTKEGNKTTLLSSNGSIAVGADQGSPNFRAVIWDGASWTELPAGGSHAVAQDVNAGDLVVGYVPSGGVRVSAVWENTGSWVKTELPQLSGNNEGEAWAVNDAGVVVGRSRVGATRFATLWSQSGGVWSVTQLDNTASQAEDINSAGVVVGTDIDDGLAVMYTESGGVWTRTDLNSLLDPGSGWNLTAAHGINDNGWIVGEGTINGETHGFVLVPEPGSLILLSVAGSLIMFHRKYAA